MKFLITLLVSLVILTQHSVLAQSPSLSPTVITPSTSVSRPAEKHKVFELKPTHSLTPKIRPSEKPQITHPPKPTPDVVAQCNKMVNRANKVVTSATDALATFNAILAKVQAYYQAAVVPTGSLSGTPSPTKTPVPSVSLSLSKTPDIARFIKRFNKILPNYQAFLSDIQTKQKSVDSAVQALKTFSATINCNSITPTTTTVNSFEQLKKDLKAKTEAVKKALHSLKESIKNLTVGIRRLTNKGNSPLPTIILSPTITPVPTTTINLTVTPPAPTITIVISPSVSITPALTITP